MGEQKDISDERNLVHLINDHLRQLAPHVMGRESAKLLGEAARELAAAKERIAELESINRARQ